MLVDREPVARISAMFGIHESAITRHRKHVVALMQQSDNLPAVADSLLGRVKLLVGRLESLANDAHTAKAGAALLQVSDRLAKFYDLLGRITGEIQPAQVQQFFIGLGVDEQRVRFLVERDREMADYSLDDAERDLLEAWSLIRESDPERADRIRSRILGGVDAEMADVVEAAVDE